VTQIASEHEREIDPEHFGVLIPYVIGDAPAPLLDSLRTRRPDLDDVSVLVPNSWAKLADTIEQFIEVGASKFVVVPLSEPRSVAEWNNHLADAASSLMPLQN
jgi:hypothetical protein